jgi:hypothetical protein
LRPAGEKNRFIRNSIVVNYTEEEGAMRRLLSIVLFVTLSYATMALAGEVRVWKGDELLASDKLVVYGKGFRDTALRPFNPASNAMKGVLESAAEAKVENIEITFEGEKNEKNKWGIGGIYYVVEALEVKFIEPSNANIKKVLTENIPTYIEFISAISHATKSPDAKEFAQILLTRIKGISEIQLQYNRRLLALNELMMNGYTIIMQKEAVPELVKILKFHAVDDVRINAGMQLIKHGDASIVEEALEKNEKSDKVKVALKKSLME